MSELPQDLFEHVAELTELYLRGEISDEQLAELEALVRSDERAARAMQMVLAQAGTMRVVFGEQRTFANRIGDVNRDEYLKLLQTLSPSEEPEPVRLVGNVGVQRVGWQRWAFVAGGIAAVLVLALTLILVFQGEDELVSPVIVDSPDWSSPQRVEQKVVATLTNVHNAKWLADPGSLSPNIGDAFKPGQRLMLAEGFAEVTTARGSVVIVEAPAAVEFTTADNAIRLLSGKLVGLCHTESSKGFVVKTKQANITDIGTEFGVSIDEAGGVDVQVFTGLVVADVLAEDGQIMKQPLVEGESARIASGQFEKRASDGALAFTRTLPMAPMAPQLTGNIRWMQTPDLNAPEIIDANWAYVWQEQANAIVPGDTGVSKPGPSAPVDIRQMSGIGDPVRADVYYLRFIPGEQAGSVTGTITFDRPILGVIPHYLQLQLTDVTLGQPGSVSTKKHPSRGMEQGKASFGDDGKTLKIHINETNGWSDELRILVAPAATTEGEGGREDN